jgi:predicted acetyltransferase
LNRSQSVAPRIPGNFPMTPNPQQQLSNHVTRATASERVLLQRMLELYQHDLSDIWDQDLDANGDYGYALDRYWRDPACTPYIIRVDGQAAGFALVDDKVKVPGGTFWMDQFFVMKKYRGRGVGAIAAKRVFALHPGQWQVGQMPANHAAQAFWRRVIGECTANEFVEVQLTAGWWQGFVQCFTSTDDQAM